MSYEKMILTPYEPSRELDDDMQDDQQTTRAYTKSYENGDEGKSSLQTGKLKCHFCSKVCANRYSLNRHMRQIHKKAKGKSTRDEHDDDDDASSMPIDSSCAQEKSIIPKKSNPNSWVRIYDSESDDDEKDDMSSTSSESTSEDSNMYKKLMTYTPVRMLKSVFAR